MLASLRVGAAGYLVKSAPLSELVSAVRFVHAGEGVFDLKAASRIMRRLAAVRDDEKEKPRELYRRELQVLRLAAKGMSNKEIASEMVLSERTIQTHLVNIFRKLNVGSRTEAVLRALKEGWLTLDDLP